uniref:HK97-gp10 family putative phage morphogenesis protein n=1 Tax=Shewanella sp. TaxID=50422 RepID=UPI004048A22E
MITFGLTGFDDLNKTLTELGGVLGKKAARAAAKKAMLPIKAEIERTSPFDNTDDGIHIKENFKIKTSGRTKKHQKTGDDVFLKCSVSTSNKEVEQYAALVEFGYGGVTVTKTNAFGINTKPFSVAIKTIKANPFMRTALRNNAEKVANDFAQGLTDEIIRIVTNKAKKEARIKAQEKKLGGNP